MRLDSTTVLQNTSQTMKKYKIHVTQENGFPLFISGIITTQKILLIIYLSIYLSIYLFIYLFIYFFIYSFIHLFIYYIIYIYIVRFRLKRWSSSPRDPRLLT